jgi:hypothetical protein
MFEREFAGRSLTADEENILAVAARSLGVLAARSPKARELLLQGTDMDYWSASVRTLWISDRDTPRIMANNCIQGIGLLPDGKQILEQWIGGTMTDRNISQLLDAVVTAAAFAEEIEMYGRDFFFGQIFMSEQSLNYFQRWKYSEKADRWYQWAEAHGFFPPRATNSMIGRRFVR